MKDKPYKVHAGRRRVSRRWRWIVLGSVAVLLFTMGSVLLGYYLWLDAKVAAANSRVSDEVRQALAENGASGERQDGSETPESPDSMNILLLGSDTRTETTEGSRSDTVILVHVDPANNYLSMLSLPRDLRVEIEGYGKQKLNYAYARGGAALTIKTVQQLTGVDIDHFLEIDLNAFGQMTYKLGGVYVEVDRPYLYTGTAYTRIDLDPGYQLLDGWDALSYVRYRHDRNADFGRMERQQRFLNALRQQAMGWNLAFKLPGLVGALLDNVATDLGTNDFLKLAMWAVRLDGSRIRQVSLRGMNKMYNRVVLVFCTPEQVEEAVDSLLTPPGAEPVVQVNTGSTSSTATTAPPPTLPTGATPDSIPNSEVWKKVAEQATFPVQAPAYIADQFRIETRSQTYAYLYGIKVDGREIPTLVMLYRNRGTGSAGEVKLQEEYINITQTLWLDAPVASPGRQVTHGDTVFTIVGTAGKVERVWWKKDGVLYWVSNSLSRVASEAELLVMAESMISIPAQ